jgi:hypothetical protein
MGCWRVCRTLVIAGGSSENTAACMLEILVVIASQRVTSLLRQLGSRVRLLVVAAIGQYRIGSS